MNRRVVFQRSPHLQSSGFTLIEIMLVVVIIALAATIALPNITNSLSSTQLKSALRSTVRSARYARSMSILKQLDCTLSFTEGRIRITNEETTLIDRQLPEKITISSFENRNNAEETEYRAHFYANGMNDGFELTLTDDKNREHTVSCHPYTGKITVDD